MSMTMTSPPTYIYWNILNFPAPAILDPQSQELTDLFTSKLHPAMPSAEHHTSTSTKETWSNSQWTFFLNWHLPHHRNEQKSNPHCHRTTILNQYATEKEITILPYECKSQLTKVCDIFGDHPFHCPKNTKVVHTTWSPKDLSSSCIAT